MWQRCLLECGEIEAIVQTDADDVDAKAALKDEGFVPGVKARAPMLVKQLLRADPTENVPRRDNFVSLAA
jgi:hypothetical protein